MLVPSPKTARDVGTSLQNFTGCWYQHPNCTECWYQHHKVHGMLVPTSQTARDVGTSILPAWDIGISIQLKGMFVPASPTARDVGTSIKNALGVGTIILNCIWCWYQCHRLLECWYKHPNQHEILVPATQKHGMLVPERCWWEAAISRSSMHKSLIKVAWRDRWGLTPSN